MPVLDPDQYDAVNTLSSYTGHGIHILQGPHGCGKNIIALHAALRRVRETGKPVLFFVSYQILFQWVEQIRTWFGHEELRWGIVRRTKLEEVWTMPMDLWICTNTLFPRLQSFIGPHWSTVVFDTYKGSIMHMLRSILYANRTEHPVTLWALTSDPDLLPAEELIWLAFVNASVPIPPIHVVLVSMHRLPERPIVPLLWSYDFRTQVDPSLVPIECPICLESGCDAYVQCPHCTQKVCMSCYSSMTDHGRPACPFCRAVPNADVPWSRWSTSADRMPSPPPTFRSLVEDVLSSPDRTLVVVFEDRDDPFLETLERFVASSTRVVLRGPSDRVRADVRSLRRGHARVGVCFVGHPYEHGSDLVFTLDLSFATDVVYVGEDTGATSTEFAYGNEMHAFSCVHRHHAQRPLTDETPRLYRIARHYRDDEEDSEDEGEWLVDLTSMDEDAEDADDLLVWIENHRWP